MNNHQGILYGPEPTQQAKVEVQLSHTGLNILPLANGNPLFLDYSALEVTWSGLENNQIECKNGPYTLYLSAPEVLPAFLEFTQGQLHATLDKIRKKSGKGRRFTHWGLLLGTTCLAGIVAVWGSYQGLFWARNYAMDHIPPEWEVTLGDQAFKELMQEQKPCENKVLVAVVDTLGKKLFAAVPDSPYPFKFHLVKSEQINAFALPGGHMVINSALLQQASSPEAVAGVMAHEMQHVLLRHGIKGMVTQLGFTVLVPVIFGDMGSVMLMLGGMGAHLINLTFSRTQESAADTEGLQLLYRAKINPQGMVDFFNFLAKEEGRLEEGLKFMSTHPLSSERVKQIQAEIKGLPTIKYEPLLKDWDKIRKEKCG